MKDVELKKVLDGYDKEFLVKCRSELSPMGHKSMTHSIMNMILHVYVLDGTVIDTMEYVYGALAEFLEDRL